MKILPAPVTIQPREWRFVLWVIGLTLVLTTLPYLFAIITAPADRQFVGFLLNTSDHAQYLAWYKAFQSQILVSNLQTSEPNPPIFFNLLWWGLAQLGNLTGFSYGVIYQIFRWSAGGFFLWMAYQFCALFLESVSQRRLAFLITAFGAGLGWILVVVKYALRLPGVPFPLDLYVSEGNTFLCILGYPHFAEAAGLILAVFTLLILGEARRQLRYAFFAGLTALFLGWQHGYDLLIVWLIPSAYGALVFVRTRRWPDYWFKAMLLVGLISWPPALYSVLLTRLNPIWKEVLAQFANAGVYTPNPLHMIILMGAPLILALAATGWLLVRGLRLNPAESLAAPHAFLVLWLFLGWALTYIPTDFQIHMISSWQTPIALLAAIGFDRFAAVPIRRRWPKAPYAALAAAFVGFVSLTNLYLFAWRFVELRRYEYPYFLYKDEIAAMTWLEANTPAGSVVFSSYDVGRYIPGLSGRSAFLSHWAQTVDFFTKRDRVASYYGGMLDAEQRRQTFSQYGVDYVFWGPAEQALGKFDPARDDSLREVFSSPRVKIYTNLIPPP